MLEIENNHNIGPAVINMRSIIKKKYVKYNVIKL